MSEARDDDLAVPVILCHKASPYGDRRRRAQPPSKLSADRRRQRVRLRRTLKDGLGSPVLDALVGYGAGRPQLARAR